MLLDSRCATLHCSVQYTTILARCCLYATLVLAYLMRMLSKKPTCAAGGHAAAEFKDMPGIIGFEIMNEPFAGDIFAQPELVLPGVAGQRNLQKMHDAVAVSSFETARAPAWVPPSKVSFACIGNQPVYDPSVLVGVLWFVCVFCRGRSVRWTRITSSSSSL